MKNLRKVYITEILAKYEKHEPEKFEGYFHKWFDGINQHSERPEQIAIIELQDGTIRECALHSYSLKFQTQEEIQKEDLKGWGGDPTIN
ncbi:hypothetical protein ATO12_17095 [Aquimarina atlantica]|uniref:Uncharacterized protein n=1 Tax=Aquimarina atlantica TaxID=1317122 RepID=A0A023BUE5_9FLAO|nr:hypothetical protein [Aquimarina atlantica]EZH73652.1 hypothetical protein ATO12_17095 [Aquimarina atlantica]